MKFLSAILFRNTRITRLAPLALGFAFLTAAAGAQTAAAPKSPKDQMLEQWDDVARRLTAMAGDFPEDKYDYRPTPEVRTFAQVLLHASFWNQYVTQTAKGGKPDGKLNELPRAQYPKKADVAAVVRKSFDESIAALKAETDEQFLKRLGFWSAFLEHSGEHYGQLVVYYRLNGLVPPESRKQ